MSSQFVNSQEEPNASTSNELDNFVKLIQAHLRQLADPGRFSKPVEIIVQVANLLDWIDYGLQSGALSSTQDTNAILNFVKSIPRGDNNARDDLHPATPSFPAPTASIPPTTPTIVEPSPSTPPRTPSPILEPLEDPRPPMFLAANAVYAAYTRGALEPNIDLPPLPESSPPAQSPSPQQQPVLVSSFVQAGQEGGAPQEVNQAPRPVRPLPRPPRPLPAPPSRQHQHQPQTSMGRKSLPKRAPHLFSDEDEDPPASNPPAHSTSQVDALAPASHLTHSFGPRARRPSPGPAPRSPAPSLPTGQLSQDDPFIGGGPHTEFLCPPPPPFHPPPPSYDSDLERDVSARPSSPTPSSHPHQHDCQALGSTGAASTLRRSRRVLSSKRANAPRVCTPSIPTVTLVVADVAIQTERDSEVSGQPLHYGGVSLHEYYDQERPHPEISKSTSSVAVQTNESVFPPPAVPAGSSAEDEVPAYDVGLGSFDHGDGLLYPEDRKRRSTELAPPNPEEQSWLLKRKYPAPPPSSLTPSPSTPPDPPQPDRYHYQPRPEDFDWDQVPPEFRIVKPAPSRVLVKLKNGVQKVGAFFRRDYDDVAGGVAPRPDLGCINFSLTLWAAQLRNHCHVALLRAGSVPTTTRTTIRTSLKVWFVIRKRFNPLRYPSLLVVVAQLSDPRYPKFEIAIRGEGGAWRGA
ncbi:hypothetical protein FA13DRAFT_1709883 [Coprinellus micaceus]|uniref:Uncharacterized protein n=1 Tax=Coprinellus micaceus TaxID=71717 RepID=A0A4Y7TAR2_COPMI|nr:hypothetical protein FA13DRAFT_1709883 [Coprinellus micaceus]